MFSHRTDNETLYSPHWLARGPEPMTTRKPQNDDVVLNQKELISWLRRRNHFLNNRTMLSVKVHFMSMIRG